MDSLDLTFDLIFKRDGGIFRTDDHYIKNSTFEDGKRLINSIRSADPRTPPVYINLINNTSLNAVATKYKGQYFIGINAGVISLVESMFLRMLANPNILSDYGNPNKETAPEKIENAQFTCFRHYYDVVGFNEKNHPVPKDVTRYQLAMLLSCFVIRFLTSHEYGHILCGHVGYGDSLFESFAMREYFNSNSPDKKIRPLISQSLEVCADLYAFSTGINNILLALEEKKAGIKNGSEIFFNGIENSLKIWLFGIFTFWRLFGMYGFNTNSLKDYSHPPEQVRSLFYFRWLEPQLITKNSIISSNAAADIVDKVVRDVEMAFAEISKIEYNTKFIDSVNDNMEVIQHVLLIMENWDEARALTLPFAHIDLPPALNLKSITKTN